MKMYSVLCMTCNGNGFIYMSGSISCSQICPVCNGSKIQTITETGTDNARKRNAYDLNKHGGLYTKNT